MTKLKCKRDAQGDDGMANTTQTYETAITYREHATYRLDDGTIYPFGRNLYTHLHAALAHAQFAADANGAPVQIWKRDGWFTVCEVPDDCLDPSPVDQGWEDWAIVDPSSDEVDR